MSSKLKPFLRKLLSRQNICTWPQVKDVAYQESPRLMPYFYLTPSPLTFVKDPNARMVIANDETGQTDSRKGKERIPHSGFPHLALTTSTSSISFRLWPARLEQQVYPNETTTRRSIAAITTGFWAGVITTDSLGGAPAQNTSPTMREPFGRASTAYKTIPIPSSANQNLYSTNGGASIYVNFRVLYATVKPGETYRQQTYVGHPWEVTTDGGYTGLFMPSATESTAYLDLPTVCVLPSRASQNLRSVDGKATVLNFTNELKVDAQLYWINHQGNRVLYATLKPGETKRQETFVGHPWEVVAAPNIKKVYLPIEGKAKVVVKEPYP
ncbi:hypothetical protein JOM56_010242 [Amanita muscaria]